MAEVTAKPWELVVVGVLFKRTEKGPLILLQKRRVQDKEYDPLYDDTWEAMGETMKPGEDVLTALLRGCAEEYGWPGFVPEKIYPRLYPDCTTTGKGDKTQAFLSYCNMHSLGPPQPWTGYAFVVEVLAAFEPNYKLHDGEADSGKWWQPGELLQEIEFRAKNIMGWHMPAIRKLCDDLIHNAL